MQTFAGISVCARILVCAALINEGHIPQSNELLSVSVLPLEIYYISKTIVILLLFGVFTPMKSEAVQQKQWSSARGSHI